MREIMVLRYQRMRQAITIFFMISLMLLTISGCTEERVMHESKERTPGDLAVIEPKASSTDVGKPAIEFTEEIMHPNAKPYEGARYEYLVDETPARVAHWFELNLEGCKVKHIRRGGSLGDKWTVTKGSLIIDVFYGPGEDNTLIRYKKDIYFDAGRKE